VLDFRLRGGTGVEVIRAVRLVAPDVRFVVLTNHPNPQYRRLCLAAGADWFLDKSSDFTKIKDLILGTRAVNASFRP
jgi:DNA-binding NarL/FixJ family response regulator